MTKHTSGEWKITQKYTKDRGIICVEHPLYDALDVVMREWAATFEEHQANARLIAAAPALLEACKDLVDRFDRKATSKASLSCSYSEAKAAIAKAEGR